jgi:hypothetical protein
MGTHAIFWLGLIERFFRALYAEWVQLHFW